MNTRFALWACVCGTTLTTAPGRHADCCRETFAAQLVVIEEDPDEWS